MKQASVICSSLLAALLAACATKPVGPSLAVMPTPGKPFDQFVAEDGQCRQYAASATGMSSNQAAAGSMAGSMALGGGTGAAAGALAGAHHGAEIGAVTGPYGAAVGAAGGLAAGALIGTQQSNNSSASTQDRFNIAYEQCMYSKGNQVPGVLPQSYRTPSS
jgi:hypothetical protein